jgi:hypothetical protein
MTIRTLRPAAVLFAAAAAFAAAGCGGMDCTLKGTVTYQGKPVIFGSVVAVGSDGVQRAGKIHEDGAYEIERLPRGPVKLCVLSPEPRNRSDLPPEMQAPPGGPAGPPPDLPRIDKSKWSPLPEQYNDPESSGLSTTVKSGDNHFDIELQ